MWNYLMAEEEYLLLVTVQVNRIRKVYAVR